MKPTLIKTEKDADKLTAGQQYILDVNFPDPIAEGDDLDKQIKISDAAFAKEDKLQEFIEKKFSKTLSKSESRKCKLKETYTVPELKKILKEGGVKGYSKLKEDQLIDLIIENELI